MSRLFKPDGSGSFNDIPRPAISVDATESVDEACEHRYLAQGYALPYDDPEGQKYLGEAEGYRARRRELTNFGVKNLRSRR